MADVTQAQVLEALSQVREPQQNQDIVSLNLVKDIEIKGSAVNLTITLNRTIASFKNQIKTTAEKAVSALPGVNVVNVKIDSPVTGDPRLMSRADLGVRNAVAVASGKGGVGKSTMATNLAISLALDGAQVGLLDVDVYGPNVPIMMGVSDRPQGRNNKILPLESYGVKLMSMGFLVDPNQAIIWRGPMLHNAIRQFIEDVEWGELDYLVIDLPPGTGDASLSLAQSLGLTGAVIITTPQRVALSDVIRSVSMFEQLNVPIFGVVENMSYFVAPDTGQRYDIFGHGGGAQMAKEVNADFLGEVPLEPNVRSGGDEGEPIVVRDPASVAAQAIRDIARKVADAVEAVNLGKSSGGPQSDTILSVVN
ncbi:MAG: Mrp/NBP35 family ATP-binding protein [Anaerolineae bacterium]|nr:Mrp/NBP35 family ATP-binding protein [Anaerolineae bacterium]MCB9109190.1 Mrp/NBP35 family ATP-binding protein [Anaerolineales bacterium]